VKWSTSAALVACLTLWSQTPTAFAEVDQSDTSVGADTEGDGGDIYIGVTTIGPGSDGGGPTSGGGSGGGNGGNMPAPYWDRVEYVPAVDVGILYCRTVTVRVTVRTWRDGTVEYLNPVCESPPPPAPTPPASVIEPPPAYTPPTVTIDEVREHVALPHRTPGVNPKVRGLVGLDTWLWWPGPTTRTDSITLAGTTVRIDFTATEWTWDTGDDHHYTSTVPGTEDDPAVTHVYGRHGTYDIVVTTTWSAEWSTTRPDGTVDGPHSLGTLMTTDTRTYEVIQTQPVRDR